MTCFILPPKDAECGNRLPHVNNIKLQMVCQYRPYEIFIAGGRGGAVAPVLLPVVKTAALFTPPPFTGKTRRAGKNL
jgi:hypothetical protein